MLVEDGTKILQAYLLYLDGLHCELPTLQGYCIENLVFHEGLQGSSDVWHYAGSNDL